MKNRNKLRRCVDFLNKRKDEVLNNYDMKSPPEKENVLLKYLKTLKDKLQEKYGAVEFIECFIDEYGNKRNLTSSIIQIYFPFDKGNTYKDIYTLVKDYFVYEVILHRQLSYVLLPSAPLLFGWKIADCFDLCNLAVSCLRTKNYEAYVVCGEAPLSICTKEDKTNMCQLEWKQIQEKKEDPGESEEIYQKKEKYKRVLHINRHLYNFTEWETSEKSSNRNTESYIHAWVLIKKSLDVEHDIFIEMSTGTEYTIKENPYKTVYFMWNDRNIYINIQQTEQVMTVISEMQNTNYMIPAFYEEIKNKALHPIVNTHYFQIRKDRYLMKFPYGANTTFYGNCKKDQYGHHLQRDGLSEHHIHFANKNCLSIEYTCSFYKNRRDNKTTKIYIPQRYKTIEYYDNCSYQFLKKYERKTGFYSYYLFYPNRSDGLLQYLDINGYKLMEYFRNRRDKIIYRSLRLSKTTKTEYVLKSYEGEEYYVEKVTVKYMSNEETTHCIYKKIFQIPERRVILCFYNTDNEIRDICEVYEKQVIYNSDREENEEVLIFKKNMIYEHLINGEKPLCDEVSYLLKEEKVFFEEIKKNYENVICAILKKKKLIMLEEERQRYLEASVTNINEVVYHNNDQIIDLSKDILEDNVNIYDFHDTYPWIENSEIGFDNSFFTSMHPVMNVGNFMNSFIDDTNKYTNGTKQDDKTVIDQLSEEKNGQPILKDTVSVDQNEKSNVSETFSKEEKDNIKLSILEERLQTYKKQLVDLNNSDCPDAEMEKMKEDINRSIRITKERIEKLQNTS